MNNYFWTEKNANYWLALALSFVPLLSLVLSFALLGGQGAAQPDAAHLDAEADVGLVGLLWLPLVGGMVLGKFLAIIGNFSRWYFGWAFHSAEIHLILFVLGILAIVSTFNQSFDLAGLLKLVAVFIAIAVNMYLRSLWLARSNKDLYRVSFYTHS